MLGRQRYVKLLQVAPVSPQKLSLYFVNPCVGAGCSLPFAAKKIGKKVFSPQKTHQNATSRHRIEAPNRDAESHCSMIFLPTHLTHHRAESLMNIGVGEA
jgi:hypothetical protein